MKKIDYTAEAIAAAAEAKAIEVDQVIQVMRTCSLAKVRAQLEAWKKGRPDLFACVAAFYDKASKRAV